MNSVRAGLFIAPMLFVAACGGDDGNKTSDAGVDAPDQQADAAIDTPTGPTFDFSCLGNAAPTTATANITLSGTVEQVSFSGLNGVEGASVHACVANTNCTGQNDKAMATSAADGSFTLGPIATGGVPADLYAKLTGNGLRETHTYAPSPFVADQSDIPVLTFDPSLISLIPGCNQMDNVNGMLGLAITDCANNPISDTANINLIVKQNGATVTGTKVVDLGGISSAYAGTYLVCNVPANAGSTTTEVGATYKTMTLRSHNVTIVAGTTTATGIRPGY